MTTSTNRRLKVLVFDDNNGNREAAKLSLADHDLTIVGTYNEAERFLNPTVDEGRQAEIFEKKYGDRDYDKTSGVSDDERSARIDYWYNEARKRATVFPDFDAVLTDLLVPASGNAQGTKGKEFVGKEMPLGTTIALLAISNGIKRVAVVTDTNHHDHPASAAFDCFQGVKVVDGLVLYCTNRVDMVYRNTSTGEVMLGRKEVSLKHPYEDGKYTGAERVGKNWGEILDQVLKAEQEFDPQPDTLRKEIAELKEELEITEREGVDRKKKLKEELETTESQWNLLQRQELHLRKQIDTLTSLSQLQLYKLFKKLPGWLRTKGMKELIKTVEALS